MKGRVTVVLPRTELQKLFASDLTVLRAKYEDAEEQLLITLEGEALPKWYPQTRPERKAGQVLDSSYVMFMRECWHLWGRQYRWEITGAGSCEICIWVCSRCYKQTRRHPPNAPDCEHHWVPETGLTTGHYCPKCDAKSDRS